MREQDGFLFDPGKAWENEWVDMPEYRHKDLTPKRSVLVHFASKADVDAFADLVGQRITPQTRSLWFPPAPIGLMSDRIYIDEGGRPNADP